MSRWLRATRVMVIYKSTEIRWLSRQGGLSNIRRWVTFLVMSDNKASFGIVSSAITKVSDWIMFELICYFLRAYKILRQLVEIVVDLILSWNHSMYNIVYLIRPLVQQ